MKTHQFAVIISCLAICSFSFIACEEDPCNCDQKTEKTLVLNSPGTIIDGSIYSLTPTTPRDQSTQSAIAYWTWGGIQGESKAYFQFNLSAIPTTATIKKATLTLQEVSTGLNPSDSVYIFKIIQTWDPALTTWDNPPVYNSTQKIVDPKDLDNSNTTTNYDITTYVQDWVNNPSQNFGMLVQIANQSLYHGYQVYNMEDVNPANRPKLVVEYEE